MVILFLSKSYEKIQLHIYKFMNTLPVKLFFTLISLSFYSNLQAQNEIETFPKIKGYLSILHPIVTFTSEETTTNFKDYYIVGMPFGINIWKSKTIGFSFEIAPFIRSDSEINKVNNVLIHPGILVKLKNNFTFAGRIAFETSGRYGFTPIITKVIKRNKDHNYYVSVPAPVRFGNNHHNSLSLGFQFGIAF